MSRSRVKGQGCQGQKSALCTPITPAAMKWKALAANNVTQLQTGPFRRCQGEGDFGGLQSMFGKTSLALVSLVACFCCVKFSFCSCKPRDQLEENISEMTYFLLCRT